MDAVTFQITCSVTLDKIMRWALRPPPAFFDIYKYSRIRKVIWCLHHFVLNYLNNCLPWDLPDNTSSLLFRLHYTNACAALWNLNMLWLEQLLDHLSWNLKLNDIECQCRSFYILSRHIIQCVAVGFLNLLQVELNYPK